MIKLLNVINLWSSTIDPLDLYDYSKFSYHIYYVSNFLLVLILLLKTEGIIDCIKGMMLEISKLKKYDDKIINEILIELLKISDNLLKYISDFVKKALQVSFYFC